MNRKAMALALGCAIMGGGASTAQVPQSSSKAFNEFRGNALKEFSDFKKKILDHYADFLNGEWYDFDPILAPNPQFETPKPGKAPVSDGTAMTGEPIRIDARLNPDALPGLKTAPIRKEVSGAKKESPNLLQGFGGGMMQGGAAQSLLSSKKAKSNYDLAVSGESDPGFAFGDLPGQEAMPDDDGIGFVEEAYEDVATQTTNLSSVYRVYSNKDKKNKNKTTIKDEPRKKKRQWTWKFWEWKKHKKGEASTFVQTEEAKDIPADILADLEAGNTEDFFFDFYDMPMFIPEIKFEIAKDLNGSDATGAQWTSLDSQAGAKEAARQLFGLAQSMGLNGYLSYRLAEAYVNAKFPDSSLLSRISATHYLLSQMGYDAKIWVSNVDKIAALMMPFDQTQVFGLYPNKGANGRRYHILPPAGYTAADLLKVGRGRTYDISSAEGKTSDLRLTGLQLPYKPHQFDITGGDINIRGEVNENFMKLLHWYPQMPMGDFATSWLDAELRADIVNQVRSQISGKKPKEAVQTLLGFFHDRGGIDYATDQDQHGFEKPYFLEENLFYPMNDCEDRAIFFTYLVWNALNLPCELIQYPGHESAAVAFEENVPGISYIYDGIKFTSSDPTYLGAPVGDVMDRYKNENPEVDKVYK